MSWDQICFLIEVKKVNKLDSDVVSDNAIGSLKISLDTFMVWEDRQ